jgi:hypothetical protein
MAAASAAVSMLAAQTVQSVTSQKERCLRKLEKVERSLENVAARLDRMRRLKQASKENDMSSDAGIEKSQSKVEYLNNRIERVRNQLDKIESDLQKVQGGKACPSCIAADVNLFCRHIESLYTENGDLVNAINECERSLRSSLSVTELCKRNDLLLGAVDTQARKGNSRFQAALSLQEKARAAVASNDPVSAMDFALAAGDSAAAIMPQKQAACLLGPDMEEISNRLNRTRESVAAKDTTGKAERILAKAQEHLEKAKSLCNAGKTNDARTELSIADKFIATVSDRSGSGK